jgi:hypothetical protein
MESLQVIRLDRDKSHVLLNFGRQCIRQHILPLLTVKRSVLSLEKLVLLMQYFLSIRPVHLSTTLQKIAAGTSRTGHYKELLFSYRYLSKHLIPSQFEGASVGWFVVSTSDASSDRKMVPNKLILQIFQ